MYYRLLKILKCAKCKKNVASDISIFIKKLFGRKRGKTFQSTKGQA